MNSLFITVLASGTLLCPVLLLALVSLVSLCFPPEKRERAISNISFTTICLGLLSSVGVAAWMVVYRQSEALLDLGHWIAIKDHSFHFHLTFVFDRLSVPFLILTYILCGTVGAFTSNYLHREPGFQRFFILYSLFTLGMVVSSLAGSIEVLFFGWELVGLSSALLVGFFHERPGPVMNGLRVWTVYRFADAAFLIAAVVLHHSSGQGDFHLMSHGAAWPDAESNISSHTALGAGLLLLVAVAGKSALIPFSGWLPRAMEGPTASSAIFYGALSVHLGIYLLLRVSPLISASLWLMVIVTGLGLATAIYANLVERVQADIKSALAFASLAQVGLIVAEIGMGWYYFALIHTIGHAMLRTLQLLRAPSLLQDYFKIETALGRRVALSSPPTAPKFSTGYSLLYRFALHRGYFDTFLDEYMALPFRRTMLWCVRRESDWIDWWGKKFESPAEVARVAENEDYHREPGLRRLLPRRSEPVEDHLA